MKIDATNNSKELKQYIVRLFNEKWGGEAVKNISFSGRKLLDDNVIQLDLFDTNNSKEKENKLDTVADEIRKKYGFNSIVNLDSKSKRATAIKRSGLVGGHAGGNTYE